MRAEQKEITEQIEFVISALSSVGRDAAKGKIRQLEARLAALNEQIAHADAPRAEKTLDIEAAADAAAARLENTADLIDQLSPHALRELIGSMVVRLEVDLTTGAVEMDLALPNWAFSAQEGVETRMGLDGNFLQRSSAKAQSPQIPILAVFGCERLARDCYDCRRRAA